MRFLCTCEVIYNLCVNDGYMQVFKLTDMKTLRKKSRLLTGYYELLLKNLSPENPDADQQPKAKKNKPAGMFAPSYFMRYTAN